MVSFMANCSSRNGYIQETIVQNIKITKNAEAKLGFLIIQADILGMFSFAVQRIILSMVFGLGLRDTLQAWKIITSGKSCFNGTEAFCINIGAVVPC